MGNDLAVNLTDLWTSEKKYNVNGTFTECCSQRSHSCCHYTQVVWKKTTKIGCGLSQCPELKTGRSTMRNAAYFACYYNPPGNSPQVKCTYDWRPYPAP